MEYGHDQVLRSLYRHGRRFTDSAQARAQNMVLDGGTLIDGTGKNPINNAVVVVDNGGSGCRRRGQVTIPLGTNIIKPMAGRSCPG
jgi:hypothetical protein